MRGRGPLAASLRLGQSPTDLLGMRCPWPVAVVPCLILQASCMTLGQEPLQGAATAKREATASHVMTAAGSHQQLERALSELRLSFFDAETLGSYTAVGPFRFLGESEDGLEFEGYDEVHARRAFIRLIPSGGDQLWARMQVADRVFLTRLR